MIWLVITGLFDCFVDRDRVLEVVQWQDLQYLPRIIFELYGDWYSNQNVVLTMCHYTSAVGTLEGLRHEISVIRIKKYNLM